MKLSAIIMVGGILESPLFVPEDPIERVLLGHKKDKNTEAQQIETYLNLEMAEPHKWRVEPLERVLGPPLKPSIKENQKLELKTLSAHLSATTRQKKKINHDVKFYIRDEPFFFKKGVDRVVTRRIPMSEVRNVLGSSNVRPYIGHHGGERSAHKAVYYVSKWVEALSPPSNDSRVVIKFIKKHIFSRSATPRYLHSLLIDEEVNDVFPPRAPHPVCLLVDVKRNKVHHPYQGPVLTVIYRQALDDSWMRHMFRMMELQLRIVGSPVTEEEMDALSNRYPLKDSDMYMCQMGPTFYVPINDYEMTINDKDGSIEDYFNAPTPEDDSSDEA
ncbi:hypothetical protein EJD97_009233 [Solanum chilense]|uniref:Uncharacterized protein n=1 Tax=Solanum chilense TaxID=4083 RepID=A0A6N2BJS1_SOLCI|nr:hypothetical protein EJD97_009233 [Solanum chilense]